jgi:hypothetical protein
VTVAVVVAAAPAAPCAPLDALCSVKNVAGDVISAATNDALQQFVNNILEGYGKAIASLGTLWVYLPSPVAVVDAKGGAAGGTPPGGAAFVQVLGYVMWVSLGIAVASLIVAGAMMTSRRRHGDGESHTARLGVIVFAVLLISSASALVSGFLPRVLAGNQASSVVGWVQGQLEWYTAGLAVLSVLIAGGRMAWTQRAMPVRDLAASVLTLIAVAGAGLVVIRLAVGAGDQFSVWVLSNSTNCDVTNGESNCFGTNVATMIALTATSPIGTIGLFLLGILALLMTYIQIALMVFRGAMLVLLAGVLPVASSFTNLETGRVWFKKALGWTIAFVLYKPAAALVYAIAFRLTGTDLFKSDGTGLFQIVTGLALMLIALVALPALMRFLVPAVASIGGGGSGGLLLGAAGIAGAGEVASGAIRAHGSSAAPSGGGAPAGGSAGGGLAPSGGMAGGAASGASAGGASAGGGAAAGGAAAGPVGIGLLAAGAAVKGGKQAASAVQAATEQHSGGEGAAA